MALQECELCTDFKCIKFPEGQGRELIWKKNELPLPVFGTPQKIENCPVRRKIELVKDLRSSRL